MNLSSRNSFKKSQNSYQHMRNTSGGDNAGLIDDSYHEQQPILLDHDNNHSMNGDSLERKEYIIKMDSYNTGGKIWRESSYDFESDEDSKGFAFSKRVQDETDPPSKLIDRFLHKQKASGDLVLDMDLEMDELQHGQQSNHLDPVAESPTNRNVQSNFSFPPHLAKEIDEYQSPDRGQDSGRGGVGDIGEVLKCSSNASFKRKSSLLSREKMKSRLMDPPEQPERKAGRAAKSGQLKSGMLGKAGMDDEDDDPFKMDGDLPEEYKNDGFSALTLAQWVSLVLILGALICSLAIPAIKRKSLWKLKLWKWEVMVLVLICGRLLSGWGIRVLVFFVERNFLLRKRVLYFVYGLRKAVQNCVWLGLVLIAWHLLFDKKVEKETNSKNLQYVTKVLVCFLVGTLLWLLKTLMVKVLASSFHVSTYFDRIQESLFNQYVIETLSGPPLIELENTKKDEEKAMDELQKLQKAGADMPFELPAAAVAKSGRVIGSGGLPKIPLGKNVKFSRALSNKKDEGITIDHLHKLNPKNISAWNMKRLMNIVRHGALSTLDEQIVLDSTDKDDNSKEIRSENEAKAAARKIFHNVAKPSSKYIYLEDLMRFMSEDEALKAISLFEGASESRKISKSSLKNWVVNAFRDRRALALTLNDTKTAVNKLHQMVNVIVGIIIGIIWLIILGIATSKFFLLLSSQLVVSAFIFGNTLKTIFEALIFLFVIHPFDVGDRCEIDGVQMVVEEMNILTTVFLRFDNQKIVYLNSFLATRAIGNFYRSPDMGDAVDFCVHIATPAEKIGLMRQRIVSYIDNKKEHWYSSPMVVLRDVQDLNMLKFSVWLTHTMNHQDMGEKWTRRALLVEEMVKIFRDLDIEFRLYPININVRAMPQLNSTRPPGAS